MKPGIHLLHKPEGVTSFSLVQASAQRAAADAGAKKPPKLCHGGALDPFATGLLLVLVGQATKLFEYLHAIPKIYEATIRWGVETDNGDPLGRVISEGDASSLTPQRIEEAAVPLVGWHDQVPPTTSNKRVAGERAYAKAHRGESFELPPSRVYLHRATWLSHSLPNESTLRLETRGGYYVRAFARDLGRAVGCGAHLSKLNRTVIGPWNDPGPGRAGEVTGRDLLPWAPSVELSDQDVGDLRQEKAIATPEILSPSWSPPAGFPDPATPIRGFHQDRLRFLLEPIDGKLSAVAEFHGGV